VEAIAASAGQVAVIGLDRVRAASELARIAPAETSEMLSRARAETLDLQPAGAAQRIVEALEVRPVLASR
jgi:hypothetical protein